MIDLPRVLSHLKLTNKERVKSRSKINKLNFLFEQKRGKNYYLRFTFCFFHLSILIGATGREMSLLLFFFFLLVKHSERGLLFFISQITGSCRSTSEVERASTRGAGGPSEAALLGAVHCAAFGDPLRRCKCQSSKAD